MKTWRTVGTENERFRDSWVKAKLGEIPTQSRLLDAGAGEQRYRSACGHLRYVSQDFGQYDGKGDAKGLQVGTWDQTRLDIVCDIVSIPEPDGSFDAVLCTEVLEHLPDPNRALKEFSRLLKSGGVLVMTAPFCSLTHFAPFHFSTGFNRYYYERHLTELGFSLREITANGNYFEFLAQELNRIQDVANRYSTGVQTIAEKISHRILLKKLARHSQHDQGSSDLLNFGYQIVAIKT